jgi:prephenate dehydrogenase
MIAVAYAGGFFSDVSGVSRSNGLMTARITLVAQRIVSANLERIERLAHELMSRKELTSAAEILDIIEGRPPA